ncbi:hypothetical protein J4E86_000240 [Alternaria arbusti]|uniref:uncharacterized protein n=1 Tax=Alternaria arbusti TaxID=232088 RepID=UPI00221F5988|nr:uncharacterized protein J4E86_000240 [Alternaria arbusti]KAI4961214.1 hypothetical protein J4E86_000240 [Alternaria arbusti]
MSDYDDDYDDYEGDFFYVEDEYMAADDLAEHAVASPPPATCGDEDMEDDWDRFDYFNDLEYASDGYDDTKFQALDVKGAKAGLKRKRTVKSAPARKRLAKDSVNTHSEATPLGHSPIVWRSQASRGTKPKTLDDNAQPYALFKNWREKLADIPEWAKGSPPSSPGALSSRPGKGKAKMAFVTEPASPPYDDDEDIDDEGDDGMDQGEGGIPQDALLAALQRQLAATGGPLTGMDPQQLLEFAMRMATDNDAGDDIAGEMAEAMLGGEEDEDDAEAEEKLLSWVAQQRNGKNGETTAEEEDDTMEGTTQQPPSPPSSDLKRSVHVAETNTSKSSLKRKAEDEPTVEGSTKVLKKKATRSFDAPTAASQAKAAPSRPTTRSKAGKRK